MRVSSAAHAVQRGASGLQTSYPALPLGQQTAGPAAKQPAVASLTGPAATTSQDTSEHAFWAHLHAQLEPPDGHIHSVLEPPIRLVKHKELVASLHAALGCAQRAAAAGGAWNHQLGWVPLHSRLGLELH